MTCIATIHAESKSSHNLQVVSERKAAFIRNALFRAPLRFLRLPLSVQWLSLLTQIPQLLPLPILYLTSSEGPYPSIIHLPSRGPDKIPLYAFVPPSATVERPLSVHLDFMVLGLSLDHVWNRRRVVLSFLVRRVNWLLVLIIERVLSTNFLPRSRILKMSLRLSLTPKKRQKEDCISGSTSDEHRRVILSTQAGFRYRDSGAGATLH
jgi:hypothetical protein